MATYVNIKQWKIDFLKALDTYDRRKREFNKFDPSFRKAGYNQAKSALAAATNNVRSFQSKLIDAMMQDKFEQPIISTIVSSFVKMVLPRVSSSEGKSQTYYILIWIKEYIDPLIPPGA
jgi:hypothetical protein